MSKDSIAIKIAKIAERLKSDRNFEVRVSDLPECVISRENKSGCLVISEGRAFECKDGYAKVFIYIVPCADMWIRKPYFNKDNGMGFDMVVQTLEEWFEGPETIYHYIINPKHSRKSKYKEV